MTAFMSDQSSESIIMYPVMETFYSIQGEGFYQGHAAFFIRLGGCNVGCVWCDVKDSWDATAHPKRSVSSLLEEVKRTNADIVIITGGEPLMYDCTGLTDKLKEAGFRTHLETSGAYPLSGSWDWICVSPKKFKPCLNEVLSMANELKVVIFNKSDLKWADQHAQHVKKNCQLFLQPEWSKEKEIVPLITTFIQSQTNWKLSLQIHKYIGVR
jgi:7-carboxy-7-deazaguanine synthase